MSKSTMKISSYHMKLVQTTEIINLIKFAKIENIFTLILYNINYIYL